MNNIWFLSVCLVALVWAKPSPSHGDVVDDVGHILGVNTPQTDGKPFPLPKEVNDWDEFIYLNGTECMDGQQTGVWLRKGRSEEKLIVWFQEGGGCFNVITCATSASNPTGFGGNNQPGYDGVFSPNDERNPWRDHSIVFIPYCSGDVHVGNEKSSVPLVGQRSFKGRANLNLVMQRLVPTFPNLKELVSTGESAGGFGSFANFDFINLGWPELESRVMVDDSGPIFHDDYLAPCLQTRMRDYWGLSTTLPPDCPQCSKQGGGGLFEMYNFLQKKYPTASLSLISSSNDAIISLFFGFGNNNGQCNALLPGLLPTFEAGLRNASETYMHDRFATMLFPGASHTYLSQRSFFTTSHEGVSMDYWLTQLMKGVFLKVNPWDGLYGEAQYTDQAMSSPQAHNVTRSRALLRGP